MIKQDVEAPILLGHGFAHYLLAFQIYLADLRYVSLHNIENFVEGDDLCLLGFARAICYGFEDLADCWAEQLAEVRAHHPDYLSQTMLDTNLLEHLSLLHTCWHEKRWCKAEELSADFGSYQALWSSAQDEKQRASALGNCANYHLHQALENDYSPFGAMPYGLLPVELLAWQKLYARSFASECVLLPHPLFDHPIVNGIEAARRDDDTLLNLFRTKASLFNDTCWSASLLEIE